MVSVSVSNLEKVFPPNVYALRDVSVEIRDGEFLVVLGPSVSGKTAFVRCIAGLETPTRGGHSSEIDLWWTLSGVSTCRLPRGTWGWCFRTGPCTHT